MASSTEGTSDPLDMQGLTPVDLAKLARSAPGRKPVWSHQSADLNLNLVSCTAGQGIRSHVNAEVDVVLIGIDGSGSIEIDGHVHAIGPGQIVIIPKGSRRAMHADSDRFAYLTCHRRRAGLMPVPLEPREPR